MSMIYKIRRKLKTALTTDGMRNTALTTDAMPDPPRIILEGPDPNSNISEAEIKQKSAPVSPDPQRIGEIIPVIRRQRSATDATRQNSEFLNAEDQPGFADSAKPQPRPRSPRTKTYRQRTKTASNETVMNISVNNSNNVQIGPQIIHESGTKNFYNVYTSEESPSRPKDEPMPHDVVELSRCEKEISCEDKELVRTHLGAKWRDVARRLGYSDGHIDHFKLDFDSTSESIHQMLRDWHEANTSDAQVGKLISAIWSSREYDCAKRLAASHKTPT